MSNDEKQLKSIEKLYNEMSNKKENDIKRLSKFESDSNKAFYCAHLSLKHDYEIKKFLDMLLDYLAKIKGISKPEDFIFNQIFKTTWKEREFSNIAIAHVGSMKISLARLIVIYRQNPSNVLRELLIDFVCDAKIWIEKIDSLQDFSWLLFNTRSAVSHGFYYMVRQSLYGVDGLKFHQYDAHFVVATLQIRNVIEYRIKQLLGIIEFKRKSNPVSFSDILSIIKGVKSLSKKRINFGRLEKINKWANYHLHKGLRPHPWQMEWAEHEISALFHVGDTSDKKSFSIYASFEVENLKILQSEFENETIKYFDKKT